MTATVVEAGDGSGRIVSNPEVGPRGPEMAPDHTRAVDLQGCGERIYKIGAVKPPYRKLAPRGQVPLLKVVRATEGPGLRRKRK